MSDCENRYELLIMHNQVVYSKINFGYCVCNPQPFMQENTCIDHDWLLTFLIIKKNFQCPVGNLEILDIEKQSFK